MCTRDTCGQQLTFLMCTRHTCSHRVTFLAYNRDTQDPQCSPTHIFNVHAPHPWSPRCGRLAALNPGVQQSRRYGPSKSPRCGRFAALNPGVQQSRRYGPSESPRCGRFGRPHSFWCNSHDELEASITPSAASWLKHSLAGIVGSWQCNKREAHTPAPLPATCSYACNSPRCLAVR